MNGKIQDKLEENLPWHFLGNWVQSMNSSYPSVAEWLTIVSKVVINGANAFSLFALGSIYLIMWMMMMMMLCHVWATSQLFRWKNFQQFAPRFAHFKES